MSAATLQPRRAAFLDRDGTILVEKNYLSDPAEAELEAGVTYRRPKSCTVLENGRPRVIEYAENDHCCARFSLVDEWVEDADVQRRGRVGHAEARLVPAREVVRLVVARLRREPFFFLHDDGAGCRQCDEARAWAVKQPRDPPVLPS